MTGIAVQLLSKKLNTTLYQSIVAGINKNPKTAITAERKTPLNQFVKSHKRIIETLGRIKARIKTA